MTLQYVTTKDQLPIDSDFECPICLDTIDIDEININETPNCVICSNGHRMHKNCLNRLHKCPVCLSTELKFCKSSLGYSYVARKGGKKRKTHKKRKMHKRRKTKNNKHSKYKKM
jgi:hypothetical protein